MLKEKTQAEYIKMRVCSLLYTTMRQCSVLSIYEMSKYRYHKVMNPFKKGNK